MLLPPACLAPPCRPHAGHEASLPGRHLLPRLPAGGWRGALHPAGGKGYRRSDAGPVLAVYSAGLLHLPTAPHPPSYKEQKEETSKTAWLLATPLVCAVHPTLSSWRLPKFPSLSLGTSSCPMLSCHAPPTRFPPAGVLHDPAARLPGDPLHRQQREARGGHCLLHPGLPQPGGCRRGGRRVLLRAVPTSGLCCHWPIFAFLGLERTEQACTS